MANMTFKANLIPQSDLGYELGSNSPELKRWKIYGDIQPQQTKTFTGVIGTANDIDNATFYFGSVRPTNFTDQWSITYRVNAIAAGDARAKAFSILTLNGHADTYSSYAAWNAIYNTSYRPCYYHTFYRLKEAGFNNNYGHALGVRLYSAWNAATAANARTITIDILETYNCTFTFYNSMLKYSAIPGTGSTNYSGKTEFDFANNGLQETGDSNTTEDGSIYFSAKTGAKGVWATSLVMEDGNGTYQSICTAADGTVTANNRTTATTKIANTNGFKVGSTIWFANATYAANTNITGWLVMYNEYSNFDSRYTLNTTLTANSLTPYAPIYLVGTVNASDGLYYLDNPWWTQTPNTTGKIYVLVGGCYDSTTSYCRITLYHHNPWYYYDGTRLQPYVGKASAVAWGDITGKPSTFTPASHTHGNLTNDGKLGTTADYAVYTTTGGKITAGTLATTDPTASGNTTSFIATISQDSKGKISATKKTVTSATTSTAGITQYTAANLNTWLNQLTTGSSDPEDNDWYISQFAGGGTTTTTFHRRPVSKLYNYIKTKLGISNKGATLAWNTTSTIASIGGTDIKVTMPSNPNSNTTYTFANGNGSFTVTPSGGSAQTISIGKPATAGTADVANSVAWGNVSGKPSTFAPSAHTHLVTEITQGNAAVAGGLDPLTQSLIGSASSNKSFGLPAAAIKIEYSTNGGSTWTDYGATDAQKKALFCETRSFSAVLGKATTAAANSTNNQLRITIEPTDRYVSFNGLYIWMSTSGNTVTVDLERSTIGAKDTFTSVFSGQSIAGWSGNNIRYFTYGSFGGGTNQTSNNYKYRLTFKQTAINSNYGSASIQDIRFLGANVWTSPNNMVSKNHLYTWNEDLNATFPAQITATAFNGNASSSSAVKDYNNGTLTTFGYSTTGMTTTSWLGSWDGYKLRGISPANAIKAGVGTTAIGAAGTPIYWNGSNFVAGNAAAASGHTHTTTLATDTGQYSITLEYDKVYKLTTGGTNVIFKTPASDNTNTHRPIQMNDSQILASNTTPLNLKAGSNITLTNTTAGTVTIAATNTTYVAATTTTAGLMSAADKVKLNGIATAANAYTLPTATTSALGGIIVGSGLSISDSKLSVNWSSAPVTKVAGMTGNVALKTLTIGNKTYNGASATTIEIADLGLASPTTFWGITDTALTDGATTTTVHITIGPTTGNRTVNSTHNGVVVMRDSNGEEFIWTGNKWNIMGLASSYALAAHVHGNILNNGTVTTTATIASNNRLLVTNASNQVVASSIQFGSTTAQYLSNKGTWVNAVTGVKGSAESSYRTGNVNLTAANIGAATSGHTHDGAYVNVSGDTMTGRLTVKGLSGTVNVDYGDELPTTGTEGQVFFQLSGGTSSNTELPTGGTTNQVLVKNSNTNGDVKWANVPGLSNYVLKAGDTMTGTLTINNAGEYPIKLKPWGGNYGTEGEASLWYCGSNASQSGYMADTLYVGPSGNLNIAGKTFISTGAPFGARIIGGNYGVLFRNDGTNFWILCTASGDQYGGYRDYSTGHPFRFNCETGYCYTSRLYGAVWNDYAEFRKDNPEEKEQQIPGKCVREVGDGTLTLTTKRLERGCEIISDTFGFSIGQDEKNGYDTPIASNGRVLAYPYESIEQFAQCIGWPVCSGPNGTVSIMTEEEEEKYPSRIIGTISEIPSYETWGSAQVKVDGRVWIRVR